MDRKPYLSPAHKEARVQACKQLLRQPDYKFHATCYFDTKKFYVNPTARYAWIDTDSYDGPKIIEDKRLLKRAGNNIKISYVIMVNALAGAVHIYITTGTQGYKGDRINPPFLVSKGHLASNISYHKSGCA